MKEDGDALEAEEFTMPEGAYKVFEALNPFFEVLMKGLRELVDGNHYFDVLADDVIFESLLPVPGLACDDSRTSQSDGQPFGIRQDNQASLR